MSSVTLSIPRPLDSEYLTLKTCFLSGHIRRGSEWKGVQDAEHERVLAQGRETCGRGECDDMPVIVRLLLGRLRAGRAAVRQSRVGGKALEGLNANGLLWGGCCDGLVGPGAYRQF